MNKTNWYTILKKLRNYKRKISEDVNFPINIRSNTPKQFHYYLHTSKVLKNLLSTNNIENKDNHKKKTSLSLNTEVVGKKVRPFQFKNLKITTNKCNSNYEFNKTNKIKLHEFYSPYIPIRNPTMHILKERRKQNDVIQNMRCPTSIFNYTHTKNKSTPTKLRSTAISFTFSAASNTTTKLSKKFKEMLSYTTYGNLSYNKDKTEPYNIKIRLRPSRKLPHIILKKTSFN